MQKHVRWIGNIDYFPFWSGLENQCRKTITTQFNFKHNAQIIFIDTSPRYQFGMSIHLLCHLGMSLSYDKSIVMSQIFSIQRPSLEHGAWNMEHIGAASQHSWNSLATSLYNTISGKLSPKVMGNPCLVQSQIHSVTSSNWKNYFSKKWQSSKMELVFFHGPEKQFGRRTQDTLCVFLLA